MIKLCIFDLDGTILSTIETINYYVSRALVREGLDAISEEECLRFVGNGARKLISRALAYRGVSDETVCERALKAYLADYDTAPFHLTEPYPGISELLSALRERGIRVAVLSNKQDSSVKLATEHFFGGLVDLALGGREGVPLKPDARASDDILSHFGVAPSECAFVGDSDVDVLTGINLGCALNVAVTWGFRSKDVLLSAGATAFADSASDVLDMIEKYNKVKG